MTRHRLRIQQFALTIRSTLHTRIIANNQRKQADRRAGLFRAFLGARREIQQPERLRNPQQGAPLAGRPAVASHEVRHQLERAG